MNSIPVSRETFIRYITNGKKPKLQNDHDQPLQTLINPLVYSEDPKNHPDILQIPMGYHFQRNFFEFIHDLVK